MHLFVIVKNHNYYDLFVLSNQILEYLLISMYLIIIKMAIFVYDL
jgi:hypothetical protein